MTIAYLFPGQGSQKKGMGQDVFDQFPELVEKASTILGYSVVEFCLEDPKNVLAQTQYMQPTLFIVNVLSYLKKVKETGVIPDFVAGHSLGEYSALFASGVIDFETGIKLVQRRGMLMSEVTGGSMIAVKGFGEEQLRAILKKHHLGEIDIANLNAPTQVVLSGPREILTKLNEVFKKEGVKIYMSLAVSGAFHSRYMQPVADKYSSFLNQYQFNEPKIPIISNVEARPYQQDKIKQLLIQQITRPVRWNETIRYLMGKNVDSFAEIGPGKVLTKLALWSFL